MHYKKLGTLFMVSSLILGSSISVLADENTDNKEQTWLEQQVYDSFSDLNFKLVDVPDNAVALNLKYADLQMAITENGYGANYEIILPDSIDISSNATSLFEKEYGDIDFSVEKVEIPDDFSADKILEKSKNTIKEGYDSYINSEQYKNIYNVVSTYEANHSVEKNITPLGVQSLASNSTLESIINKYNSDQLENEFNDTSKSYDTLAQTAVETIKNKHNYTTETSRVQQAIYWMRDEATNGVKTPEIDANYLLGLETQAQELFGTNLEDLAQTMFDMFNEDFDKEESMSDEDYIYIELYNAKLAEYEIWIETLSDEDWERLEEIGYNPMVPGHEYEIPDEFKAEWEAYKAEMLDED